MKTQKTFLILLFPIFLVARPVEKFNVFELAFEGPQYTASENPVRDVVLTTEWQHESGRRIEIHGFFDGDGRGNAAGNVFKVRFCPTLTGYWTLRQTSSNVPELNDQHKGLEIECVASDRPGFWVVDQKNGGGRWYKRSDGSHDYIVGNTLYSFLSERDHDGPNQSDVASDIKASARYFKKIRFGITGDRYPHPQVKPFLDFEGNPTDDGDFSHRPNPRWFQDRVDVAVQTAHDLDLITDLILNGPDTEDSRSVLVAAQNGGDPLPILRYIAARYGSYPNVWICLANEWDIKTPKFTAREITRYGHLIKPYLAYHTPLSVHAAPKDWNPDLNTMIAWNDHVILQYKIKSLNVAAQFIEKNYWIGGPGKPVIDDELAYEGDGDRYSEEDVIEAHLGAFIGGGYGTTGFKHPKSKQGHYFTGDFKAKEHTSADNLLFMREIIDQELDFWKMVPVMQPNFRGAQLDIGPFRNIHKEFTILEWRGNQYVLASNQKWQNISVRLPKGIWQIIQADLVAKTRQTLTMRATEEFKFDTPASRASMTIVKRID
ncbi:DUF5060 domain-containing protein [candidate division KSB1 bacterium]|nr:DUF5060 domain-containing protein [candidate division KSB1 bacterium]